MAYMRCYYFFIIVAPCIRAADRDKVYWAEVPRMVLVNKERRRPLGIYIISRKVFYAEMLYICKIDTAVLHICTLFLLEFSVPLV